MNDDYMKRIEFKTWILLHEEVKRLEEKFQVVFNVCDADNDMIDGVEWETSAGHIERKGTTLTIGTFHFGHHVSQDENISVGNYWDLVNNSPAFLRLGANGELCSLWVEDEIAAARLAELKTDLEVNRASLQTPADPH